MQRDFDVIVVGAGPAGSFLAKELSRQFSVLLIEKNKPGASTKAWTTSSRNIRRHHIEDCVIAKPTRCIFRHYLGSTWIGKASAGDFFPVVDEHKVLKRFINEFRKNKGKCIFGSTFKSYSSDEGKVVASTTHGRFSARLLIDASGWHSSIERSKHLLGRRYYYTNYGVVADNININPDEILLAHFPFPSKARIVFQIYPFSKNAGSLLLYTLAENPFPLGTLKKKFQQVLNLEMYKHLKTMKVREEKSGYIPLTIRSRHTLDRVLLVGDAGGLTPPFTGGGFDFVLEFYPHIASKLRKILPKDNLGAEQLDEVTAFPPQLELNFDFQRLVTLLVTHFSDEQLNRTLDISNQVGSRTAKRFFHNRATVRDIESFLKQILSGFSLRELLSAIPKEDLPEFSRILLRLAKDMVQEELMLYLKEQG